MKTEIKSNSYRIDPLTYKEPKQKQQTLNLSRFKCCQRFISPRYTGRLLLVKTVVGLLKLNQRVREARQTFKDSSEASVVHLVGAVEDNDELAQTATHVFDCLCLTSTRRASRCPAQ